MKKMKVKILKKHLKQNSIKFLTSFYCNFKQPVLFGKWLVLLLNFWIYNGTIVKLARISTPGDLRHMWLDIIQSLQYGPEPHVLGLGWGVGTAHTTIKTSSLELEIAYLVFMKLLLVWSSTFLFFLDTFHQINGHILSTIYLQFSIQTQFMHVNYSCVLLMFLMILSNKCAKIS